MKHAYFIVEGPHDVEVIGRLLKIYGSSRIQKLEDLDPFWERLIPRTFPVEGDLLTRVPIPTFFQGEALSIAVHSAGSDSQLITTLKRVSQLELLDTDQLFSVALFCDADNKKGQERCKKLIEKMGEEDIEFFSEHFSGITQPGVVVGDSLKVGIYVFPDNEHEGTLEHVLLQCAGVTYQNLLTSARDYVGAVEEEHRKKWGPTGESKALIGCIANVLRPGKANQVSIQDNNWICNETIHLPVVSKLDLFLKELLGLS